VVGIARGGLEPSQHSSCRLNLNLSIRYRSASRDDAPALAHTLHLGFASYREWAPRGWVPPPPQLHLIGIRERLPREDAWCLLAEDESEPAGHVALLSAGEPGLAHLWMLFVREPWWGTGLASELLGRATAEASARGYATFRLQTPVGQARARRFYEREGWTLHGEPVYEPSLALDLVEYRRPLPARSRAGSARSRSGRRGGVP
jgi:GNAT superfamily N-acetyltransferase